jgi:hypothetical protein
MTGLLWSSASACSQKCVAILTATTGNKGARNQKHSASDAAQVDEVALKLQQSDVFACEQPRHGEAGSKRRGTAQVIAAFEGLHDNCRDTASGLSKLPCVVTASHRVCVAALACAAYDCAVCMQVRTG